MRLRSFIYPVLLASCWAACHRNGDSGTTEPEPEPAECNIERTAQCIAGPLNVRPCKGEPIRVGALCDDIFVCIADESEARALMDVASGFTCGPGPGEPAMCDGSRWTCQWISPGTIDETEMDAICAVTVLPIPVQLACMVYV